MNTLVNTYKSFVFVFLFLLGIGEANAQCDVQVFASTVDVLCGDTVKLGAIGEGVTVFENDFDGCNVGTGWSATSAAQFNDPCQDKNGTCYLWMGSTATAPRNATTNAVDLSTGGTICFDMRYAIQGNASPCEGVDLPDEGVTLQFSNPAFNGGAWTDIRYYNPNGGSDPIRTSWTRYCEAIPVEAEGPNVQVRWIQLAASGNTNDHWGLEDVVIEVNPPGAQYTWQHVGTPQPTGNTPPVVPSTTTTYTCDYEFGGCTSTASVTVNVRKLNISATKQPATPICPDDSTQLIVFAEEVLPPQSCGASTTGCVGNTATINVGTGTVNNTGYEMFGIPPPGGPITVATCTNGGGNYDQGVRTQFIVLASEIPAFFEGGQFYNMELNATADASLPNMVVKMGCTNKTSFASAAQTEYVTGLTTVFTRGSFAFTAGWNPIEFDTPYDWDGVSNLVIQVCGSGAANITGNVFKTNTGFNSVVHTHTCAASAGCEFYQANQAVVDQNRPSLRFGVCYRPQPNLSYTWTPDLDLSDANARDPKASPNSTTTYTVSVHDLNTPAACAVTTTVQVQVDPAVDFTSIGDTVCVGEDATLTSGTSTGTINWTGPGGFTSSDYNPTVPAATMADSGTYTFTVTGTACGDVTKSVDLNVVRPPNPGTPTDITLCTDGSAIDLFDQLAGEDADGTWSVAPATAAFAVNTFDPSLITGGTFPKTFTATYAVSNTHCGELTAEVEIIVNQPPFAGVGRDSIFCETHGEVDLFDFVSGSPVTTGTWTCSTPGVVGFNAANGTWVINGNVPNDYQFEYTLSAQAPCQGSSTSFQIQVTPKPQAGEDKTITICSGDTTDLFALLDPTVGPASDGMWTEISTTPSLGILSMDGVFEAKNVNKGVYQFQYIMADELPCKGDTALVTVTVNDAPRFSNAQAPVCSQDNTTFTVELEVSDGDAASYAMNEAGTFAGAAPATFTSDPIVSGSEVDFVISDGNGCGTDTITIQKNCACRTSAGTMSSLAIDTCGAVTVNLIWNNDSVNDGDDGLVFILHEGSGPSIVNPVDTNSTPSFTFDPSRYAFETQYYVSAVAANLAGGVMDYDDPCKSISVGTPVTFHQIPNISVAIDKTVICPNDPLTITFSQFQGQQPYTVLVDGGAQNDSIKGITPGNPSRSINGILADTSFTYIEVVDGNGCSQTLTDVLAVVVNSASVVSLTGTDSACFDGTPVSFDVDVQGEGTSFEVRYTNLTTGVQSVQSGLSPGISTINGIVGDPNVVVKYSVDTVISNQSSICPAVAQGVFTVIPTPTVSITTGQSTYCTGAAIDIVAQLTGIGNWQIDISTGSANRDTSLIATGSGQGFNLRSPGVGTFTYTATVTELNSSLACASSTPVSFSFTVGGGPVIQAEYSGTAGETNTLFCDGSAPNTIDFSVVSGTAANYDVTFNYSGGPNDNVVVPAAGTSFSMNSLGSGTYPIRGIQVREQGGAQCFGTFIGDTITIKQNPVVNFNPSASVLTVCEGDSATLAFDVISVDSVSFSTTTPGATVTNLKFDAGTGWTAKVLPPDTGTFVYTISGIQEDGTPSCTNTSTSTIQVSVIPSPSVTITSSDIELCQGGAVSLAYTITGSGTINADLFQGTTLIASKSQPAGDYTHDLNILPHGDYTYTFDNVVVSGATCQGQALGSMQVTINKYPNAEIRVTPDEVCFGEPVTVELFNIDTADVVGPYNFVISGLANSGSDTSITISYANPTFSIEKYFATSDTVSIKQLSNSTAVPCVVNDISEFAYVINQLPTATLSADGNTICQGESSELTFILSGQEPFDINFENVQEGKSFTVSHHNPGEFTYTVTPNATAEFVLIDLEDGNGCKWDPNNQFAVIPVSPTPKPDFYALQLESCPPLETTLINTTVDGDNARCRWDFGNGAISNSCANQTLAYTEAGEYDISLEVISDDGCRGYLAMPNYLTVNPFPIADFKVQGDPTIIESQIKIKDQSSLAQTYVYETTFGNSTTQAEPSFQLPFADTGTYYITQYVESIHGCRDSITKPVVVANEVALYIPKAFTPDGDGTNDIFAPQVLGITPEFYEFSIYDRWGELLYYTTVPNSGWDGVFNGFMSQTGVYAYRVKIKREGDAQRQTYFGYFSLLR